MEKLYIPTTTLNFNNILSSESISPKIFYEKRGFGYNRWFPIPENNIDNVVLLYKSLCFFKRPISDYEDHSLLIEVILSKEFVSSLTKYKDGVYCCDHTIYLTPWNTRFLFFSEEDKRITLSMSESSFETKLLKLYSKRFFVEQPMGSYDLIAISKIFKINTLEIQKDFRINKMKGLLYGYYIGALLSSTQESVIRLNAFHEIHNIFAAILSTLERIPTNNQLFRLDLLFSKLRETDSFYKVINDIIGDIEKTDQVLSYIKTEYGYIKNEIDKERLLKDLSSAKDQTDSKNPSKIWIEKEIERQQNIIIKERQLLSTNKSEIVVMEDKLSIISDNIIGDRIENLTFKAWINDLLSSIEYNGKVNSFREQLSDDITTKAKEIYEEKWNDSYAKEFLNKLRRHVRGSEFEVQWNNGIFSSIAAVVTNGAEWSKFLLFMQRKEMYDYRLSFAIFGTLNGFANMTRDFTDILYSCDSKYIVEVYKEIYGQLFGIDPAFEILDQRGEPYLKDDIALKSNKTDIAGSDETSKFIDSLNAKFKSTVKDKHRYEKLFNEYGNSNKFLHAINEDKTLNKGKGVPQNVASWIKKGITQKKTTQNKQSNQESTLFFKEMPHQDSEIIFSPSQNCGNMMEELSCFRGVNKDVMNRLKTNWDYVLSQKDQKKDIIDYFINLCKKEGDGRAKKRTALSGFFTEEVATKCKNELEEKYD